jgi:hypothetical protein
LKVLFLYTKPRKPMKFTHDIVIVGAGLEGLRAAVEVAGHADDRTGGVILDPNVDRKKINSEGKERKDRKRREKWINRPKRF